MDLALQQQLVELAERDQRVLEELFQAGELPSTDYHPRMRQIHEENAATLRRVIAQYGWPGRHLVGAEGTKAAWLVAQHAVSDLLFMKECLVLLKEAVASGSVEGWQLAFLQDRVLTMSGEMQYYGTQFDLDPEGWPVPMPIADPETVDRRRADLGLNTLAERVQQMRERERLRRQKAENG
ncbi:DUF6624 domain-containing protein [Alkalilimnicola sp. S0819]|uniref:DUF6624 domain-containing protein n=1 Tax=Alkalilimnicola sp. S0819 TaxID=2613922 RepID=UPI00126285E4|nr:DUF6624 domain-containing protein [Alkalilimnicola sp. S0819]KAB7619485.1 hypothetical protein F3N43_13660 [Alkalilimnicola sp. S0819]MPQ17683.1 hypothetical protein [Alkalilimnicola sp. S0819]